MKTEMQSSDGLYLQYERSSLKGTGEKCNSYEVTANNAENHEDVTP